MLVSQGVYPASALTECADIVADCTSSCMQKIQFTVRFFEIKSVKVACFLGF